MKIIQLMARVEGSGVTRYVIELNKGFKAAGYDAEIVYLKAHNKAELNNNMQTIDNIVEYDYSDETVKHINEADFVIVNSIMSKKADEKYRKLWIDLLENKITTRKAIVCNDHNVMGFNSYYGSDLLNSGKFWRSFDKIITFAPHAMVAQKIRQACGSEKEFNKRFVQLLLPHSYSEDDKKLWVPVDKKFRRVTYLGRHAGFKDPERLLRGREWFYAHNYELEMRGIKRTMGVATVPDLLYTFDADGNRTPTTACILTDDKVWREEHNIAPGDSLIDYPREKGWCYIFGEYKREEGMQCVARSAFGCDFFHLKNANCYGDNFEYSVFEIIQMGTIPLLDFNAGDAIYMYDEKMNNTETTALENGYGIFLKKDLSNIDSCLTKMDYLLKHPDEYDNLRNEIFEAFKKHCDPVGVATKLVNECFYDDPNYGPKAKIEELF